MTKKWLLLISPLLIVLMIFIFSTFTNRTFQVHPTVSQERVMGKVVETKTIKVQKDAYQTFTTQKISVLLHEQKKQVIVTTNYESDGRTRLLLENGQQVFLTKTIDDERTIYQYSDVYRLDKLFIVVLGFFLLVLVIVGKQGFGSFVGLIISISVIFLYVVPQILNGSDPFLTSVIGSFIITLLSIYPAHGISKQTSIALVATIVILLLMVLLVKVLTWYTLLTGYSTDDAFSLRGSNGHLLQMNALLMGGIIIATAGALDDVTTTQTVAIFQLAKAKSELSVIDLIQRGMRIGQEHVISLINTLVIAFVGSSFIFFVSLFGFYSYEGLWIVMNREFIAEEIVTSVVISTGLILAVPVSTILASIAVKKKSITK